MQIRNCDSCGTQLQDQDPSVVVGEAVYCKACAGKLGVSGMSAAQGDSERATPPRGVATVPTGELTPEIRVESDQSSQATPPRALPAVPTNSGDETMPRGAPAVALEDAGGQLPREIPTPPLPPPGQTRPKKELSSRTTAFYYCEDCGKRVTDKDLEAGRARDKKLRGIYCGACSQGTMTLGFEAEALSKEELARKGSSARSASSTKKVRSIPARRSSSARLPAAQASPVGPQSTSARLQARPQKRRTRGAASSSSGLVIGAVVVVAVLVAAFVFFPSGNAATNTAKKTGGDSKPDKRATPTVSTPTKASPASKTTVKKSPSDSNVTKAGTKKADPETPAKKTPTEKKTPPEKIPVPPVEPDDPPEKPAGPVEADLANGLERAGKLIEESRYSSAQQLLTELKTSHAEKDWWEGHQKNWATLSQAREQQWMEMEEEANEARTQLRQEPTADRVKQVIGYWSPYARNPDAKTADLARDILEEAKRANQRLAAQRRDERQKEIETQLTAFEAAVKTRLAPAPKQQQEMAESLNKIERDILKNPEWESAFVPRLLGLQFDLRRVRDGELMLQKAKIRKVGGGTEISYDFSTDPRGVWRFSELDAEGTRSQGRWDKEKQNLFLEGQGSGSKPRQKHHSTAQFTMPFPFQPQNWRMEADVEVGQLGMDNQPTIYGLMVAENRATGAYFGFSETKNKKGEEILAFKACGKLFNKSKFDQRTVDQIPAPKDGKGKVKLLLSCVNGKITLNAMIGGNRTSVSYSLRPFFRVTMVGCFVRNIATNPASGSFDNFKVLGMPDKKALEAQLKSARDLKMKAPIEQWRKRAQARHGVVNKPGGNPTQKPDGVIDRMLNK